MDCEKAICGLYANIWKSSNRTEKGTTTKETVTKRGCYNCNEAKAYRLWTPNLRTVIKSRDIRFMETIKEHDDVTNKPLENLPFTVELFDEPTYVYITVEGQ